MIGWAMVVAMAAAIARMSSTTDPVSTVVDAVASPVISNITAGAVLLFVVILILRGLLVPRAVMRDRIDDKEKIIAALEAANAALTIDRDRWHEAHRVSESGRAELKEQNTKLIEAGETQNRFFDKFHDYLEANTPREGGGGT